MKEAKEPGLWFVAIVVLILVGLAMPYLVWIAMRDNGRSRLDAWLAIVVAYAIGLVPLAWRPPGGFIWMVLVWFLEGTLALVFTAVRARRERLNEEAARLYM